MAVVLRPLMHQLALYYSVISMKLLNRWTQYLNENSYVRIFILFLVVSFLCVFCSSNTFAKSYGIFHDVMFKMSMRLGCNIKYPDSQKMCKCHADVLYEVTPPEVRRGFAADRNAKMKLISIMLENSEKLDACGKRPPSAKKEKETVPTECYSGADKPAYYLKDSETGELTLSQEQQNLINSVSPSITAEELQQKYYSFVSEEMDAFRKILDSKLSSKVQNNASNVNKILTDAAVKTRQCSDSSIRHFYTTDEVDGLYKLYYAGYPMEKAKQAIFEQGFLTRNLNKVSKARHKAELYKYLRCEIKVCMSR